MKLVNFAIASIVDANTHYLHHGDTPDYNAAIRHGREIRGKSVVESLNALSGFVSGLVDKVRARIRERREVAKLLHLNDALLADIGLSRGDLVAVQYGITSLEDLKARRESRHQINQDRKQARILPTSVESDDVAANEAVFASAKCA